MSIENEEQFEGMRRVGRVVGLTLQETVQRTKAGMTTADLDRIAANILTMHGARSAPRLFYDFPAAICISVNDEIVHGIPGSRRLQPGDVVKIDVTAELDGYVADAARTVVIHPAPKQNLRLAACARKAFVKASQAATAGEAIRVLGKAVESVVKKEGFSVIRDLGGHGVGRHIHETPSIPNFDTKDSRERLHTGLVIALEPIIAAGKGIAVDSDDGWTICTRDGSIAAHYEDTIVISEGQPHNLTAH